MKKHSAEKRHEDFAANAVRFEVALYANRQFLTATATTLEAAMAEAKRLLQDNPTMRRPMIYGVTAEGKAGLIPIDYRLLFG